jgi:hypothetical protein
VLLLRTEDTYGMGFYVVATNVARSGSLGSAPTRSDASIRGVVARRRKTPAGPSPIMKVRTEPGMLEVSPTRQYVRGR